MFFIYLKNQVRMYINFASEKNMSGITSKFQTNNMLCNFWLTDNFMLLVLCICWLIYWISQPIFSTQFEGTFIVCPHNKQCIPSCKKISIKLYYFTACFLNYGSCTWQKKFNSCTRTWPRHRNSMSLFFTSHNKFDAIFFVTVNKLTTRSSKSCGCLCSAVLSISKSQIISTSKLRPVEGSKQHAVMLNEARTVAKVQIVT